MVHAIQMRFCFATAKTAVVLSKLQIGNSRISHSCQHPPASAQLLQSCREAQPASAGLECNPSIYNRQNLQCSYPHFFLDGKEGSDELLGIEQLIQPNAIDL